MDNLNAKQQEAVEHKDGPLLVVAGAGTGKTRVITHRIAHLIRNGIPPREILAVTFTNKAASEMRERVDKLLTKGNPSVSQELPFVGTFHSLGVHILRESGQAIGVSRWFAIFDRDDAISLVRKCLKEEGFDPKQFAPGAVLSAISKAKGNLISVGDLSKEAGSFYTDTVVRVWKRYEQALREQKALDFDDLLVETVRLLAEHESVRKRYQSKWKYFHVDEYQDTNKAQYEMIKLLAGEHPNICAVGDGDQTIYTWRGATIENILGFEQDFPGAKVVVLDENYRSTSNILDAANSVISKNENRKDKNLFTSAGTGEGIVLYEAFDPGDEAHFVTETVGKLVPKGNPSGSQGLPFEEIAVLYRANFQSRALEEAFLHSGIPYTVLGTRFYERAEIKDILAYVKAALNPLDRVNVARAAANPRRGLGDKTLAQYFAGETVEKMTPFLNLLNDIKEKLGNLPLPEALRYIARTSGYENMLKHTEEQERLENIQELVNLSSKYKSLPSEEALEKFLTDAGLASDQDALLLEEEKRKKKGVRLMTVHAAKGLEFEHVFIVGLEQDLFPHRPMDDDWSKEKSEEERRLFYVALTRAKKRLYLSHAQFRSVYGESRVTMPSEFLSDIPSELIEARESNLEQSSGWPGGKSNKMGGYLPDIEDII